jgi:hypothetical protein
MNLSAVIGRIDVGMIGECIHREPDAAGDKDRAMTYLQAGDPPIGPHRGARPRPRQARSLRRIGFRGVIQRMEIANHRLHPRIEEMGVDLRRRDIGMAQKLLDDAKIRAILQQMGREGMAQHMRRDRGRPKPRPPGERLEIARKDLAGEMTLPALCREQKRLPALWRACLAEGCKR